MIMYTLHKLLKGRRKEERKRRSGKSSELLTQKENEDIVNILASTSTGTLEGGGAWGCVTVGGSGKDKQASVSVFSQKNVQLGTN